MSRAGLVDLSQESPPGVLTRRRLPRRELWPRRVGIRRGPAAPLREAGWWRHSRPQLLSHLPQPLPLRREPCVE
jgi:hypothetical protein